jgi:hypothetical protein
MDSECFSKNPRLKDQKKDGKGHKSKPGSSHMGTRKPLKRRPTTNDKDNNMGGPKDPKKPTFMVTKVSGEDINAAFREDVKGNIAIFNHTLAMMAIKTLPIRNAWIINSRCAQHIYNNTLKFVQLNKYHGLPLKSVNTLTTPSGVGTVNVLCNIRGRRKWLILNNILFILSAHTNLISVL